MSSPYDDSFDLGPLPASVPEADVGGDALFAQPQHIGSDAGSGSGTDAAPGPDGSDAAPGPDAPATVDSPGHGGAAGTVEGPHAAGSTTADVAAAEAPYPSAVTWPHAPPPRQEDPASWPRPNIIPRIPATGGMHGSSIPSMDPGLGPVPARATFRLPRGPVSWMLLVIFAVAGVGMLGSMFFTSDPFPEFGDTSQPAEWPGDFIESTLPPVEGPVTMRGIMEVIAEPIDAPTSISFELVSLGSYVIYSVGGDGVEQTEVATGPSFESEAFGDTDKVWRVSIDSSQAECVIRDESGRVIARGLGISSDTPCVYDPAFFTFR